MDKFWYLVISQIGMQTGH